MRIAAFNFCAPLRVGNPCPRHGDNVSRAFGYDLLGFFG
jgi:hypothetical protein